MLFLVLMERYRIIGERYGYLPMKRVVFSKFFSSASSQPFKNKGRKGGDSSYKPKLLTIILHRSLLHYLSTPPFPHDQPLNNHRFRFLDIYSPR